MDIDDVPPDDIPAAIAFAQKAIAEGWWDGDWASSLLNKQTHHRELMAALSDIGTRHDNAMLLAELLQHAQTMAEQIIADAGDDDVGHMADVERLIRQAGGLMRATEAGMSGQREEHEAREIEQAKDEPPEPLPQRDGAPVDAVDAVRRVLAKHRPPAK